MLTPFFSGSGGVDYDDITVECNSKFRTLDDLEKAKNDIPTECVARYTAEVQIQMMDGAMDKYTELVDQGYDKKFEIYSNYVSVQVPAQIDQFMIAKADKYFKCTGTYLVTCCNSCTYATCFTNCKKGDSCKNGKFTGPVKCPDTLKYGPGELLKDHVLMSATYELTDKDGFWADIGTQYSIDESWVTFGSRNVWPGASCQYAKDVKECQRVWDYWYYNYPGRAKDMKAFNPKNVFGKSYDKTKDLIDRLNLIKRYVDISGSWQWIDLLDASTMPALALNAAVDNMKAIVKKADDIKKKEREEFIINFVTSLLFFIPMVGEAAGAAGLTAARSMLRLVGEAGDLGLLTYGIVEDPKSAFMAIFAYVAGAGVGQSGFKDAAGKMRGMGKNEKAALGPSIKRDLDRIWEVRSGMCRI